MTDTTSQEALPVVAWESSGDWTDDAEVAEFFEVDPIRSVRRFADHAAATAIIDALRAERDKAKDMHAEAFYAGISHQERARFYFDMTRDAQEIASAANERAATAEAERDALRADAERYQWLRKRQVLPQEPPNDQSRFSTHGKALDEAIDSARKSEGAKP